jgi:hypothetical protein
VSAARDAVAEKTGCWLFGGARDAEVPEWSVTELYVGDQLLEIEDTQVAALFEQMIEAIEAA